MPPKKRRTAAAAAAAAAKRQRREDDDDDHEKAEDEEVQEQGGEDAEDARQKEEDDGTGEEDAEDEESGSKDVRARQRKKKKKRGEDSEEEEDDDDEDEHEEGDGQDTEDEHEEQDDDSDEETEDELQDEDGEDEEDALRDSELLMEYYQDGVRRKAPRTRSQARLLANVQNSIQEYAPNVVDSLPDEVLQLVLARLTPAELLPLRLVCRRWDAAVRDESVWWHRSLVCVFRSSLLSGWGTRAFATFLAVVRVAPTLRHLHVDCQGNRGLERNFLRALQHGGCQVRSLRLVLTLTTSPLDAKLVCGALEAVAETLQRLDLRLPNGGSVVPALLDVVDGMRHLRALRLGGHFSDDFWWRQWRAIDFDDFHGLRDQLEELDAPLLSKRSQKLLVEQNASTLRVLACQDGNLDGALSRCASLAHLTLYCSSAVHSPVPTLDALPGGGAALLTLTLVCHGTRWGSMDQAKKLLSVFVPDDRAAPGLSPETELHLELTGEVANLDGLVTDRVGAHLRGLTLGDDLSPTLAEFVRCLRRAPGLRTLALSAQDVDLLGAVARPETTPPPPPNNQVDSVADGDGEDGEAGAECPALRRVVVRGESFGRAVEDNLKRRRPDLRVERVLLA